MAPGLTFPDDSNRHAIVGMTGSGKTQAGLYALQRRSYHRMPWLIFDFKRDAMIARIPRVEEIGVTSTPPKHAGLYVVRPSPLDEESVESLLWRLWERGRTGIYIDEGYSIKRHSKGLQAILTQGRSLRLPVISLSQRPSWISPFLLSESEFLQMFYLHNPNDTKTMREWIPMGRDEDMPRDFHSVWFDVKANRAVLLSPVPEEEEILTRFDDRVPRLSGRIWRGIMRNEQRNRPRAA
jgi:hypothetical protein